MEDKIVKFFNNINCAVEDMQTILNNMQAQILTARKKVRGLNG